MSYLLEMAKLLNEGRADEVNTLLEENIFWLENPQLTIPITFAADPTSTDTEHPQMAISLPPKHQSAESVWLFENLQTILELLKKNNQLFCEIQFNLDPTTRIIQLGKVVPNPEWSEDHTVDDQGKPIPATIFDTSSVHNWTDQQRDEIVNSVLIDLLLQKDWQPYLKMKPRDAMQLILKRLHSDPIVKTPIKIEKQNGIMIIKNALEGKF